MKCVILAAGYATRLYPLTENFPKPLLAVGEKNILEWLIEDIGDSEIRLTRAFIRYYSRICRHTAFTTLCWGSKSGGNDVYK